MTKQGRCTICAAFAAVFVSAIPATASALPAFYECRKVGAGAGNYANANCSTNVGPGAGKYKATEGIGKGASFKGRASAPVLRSPPVNGEIICKSGTETGHPTSPTTVGGVVITLTGCATLKKKCTTSGAIPGKIVTNPLGGTLGYISHSPLRVGIDLSSEAGDWADIECEGLLLAVSGSVIAELTGNVNISNKRTQSLFRVSAEGAQEVRSFEGSPTDILLGAINGSGPFEFSLEASFSVKKGPLIIVG
jgi:hypothetical protein